ncbi:hypothetical protein IV102_14630 [bacterium]|nr:hypothetical protein [bacterium]
MLRGRFLRDLMISDYLQKHLHENPKYQQPGKLNRFEHQVFSQNGEDGMLEEIFRRIGCQQRYFVEFGVGNGTENNTAALLFQSWRGLWLEANANSARAIRKNFSRPLASSQLIFREAFLTRENICSQLERAGVPHEFDLLSIDVDGNDFHFWEALQEYRPRVVVIEYNAIFSPSISWTLPYDPTTVWDRSSWTGSSLQALFELGTRLGYELVGCNFSGVNAFFVRRDLVGDRFLVGPDCELHYEPPRYFLHTRWGHCRRIEM